MDTFGNQHRMLCGLVSVVGLFLLPSTTHPLHTEGLGTTDHHPLTLKSFYQLGALRIHLHLAGNESTIRGCVSTSQVPAAPVPQDLWHNPLLGQIKISVQASSILTACMRALPGQGAHKTLPGAMQLAQNLQAGRELLWERNQCTCSWGAAGSHGGV